jgi:RNA recognition motif-containing protein
VSAAKALKGLSLDDGKKVDIKTPNNGDYNSQTSIFISNLNEAVNEALLIEEFSQFGMILSCMVNLLPTPHLLYRL